MEETDSDNSNVQDEDEGERKLRAMFRKGRHAGYKISVLIVLEGIAKFNTTLFNHHARWIVPILSQLLICNDKDVRMQVKVIYETFINPLILGKLEKC